MISHQFIQKHLLQRSVLSDILSPLGSLNSFIQTAKRRSLLHKAWKPIVKVISIGNITSGGSGKTPFGIYLARLLSNKGIKIAISHRGYKGELENTPTIISLSGKSYNVKQTGDEAYLISSKVPDIPVVVGKKRIAAVSLLQAVFPQLEVVLLDDGMQHRQLHRNMDIVCFDAETGIGNGRVIPSGYLREPLSALNSSCAAVVIHKHSMSETSELDSLLRLYTSSIFHCFYQPTCFVDANNNTTPIPAFRGQRVALMSGIANPKSFSKALAEAQISAVSHFIYPDHYAFQDAKEIDKVLASCRQNSVEFVVCTEKDLAKLAQYQELRDILLALRIELVCPEEEALLNSVLASIRCS